MHIPCLDPGLKDLIQPHTGPRMVPRPAASRGYSSDFAALIEGEKNTFFVKAMRNRPGGDRASIIRESTINPFLRSVTPALLWSAENHEWVVLGFEYVDGRPSSFETGSEDLPAITDLLNRIGDLALPAVALDWPETRWDRFATSAQEAELFRGDALLHTDINENNLLVGSDRAWAVDWAWPSRGAGFIDPATLVVQLIAAGHDPASAESWAARCEAWAKADPLAIDAFAAADVRMSWRFALRRPEETWLRALAEAAEAWAAHRGVTVAPQASPLA